MVESFLDDGDRVFDELTDWEGRRDVLVNTSVISWPAAPVEEICPAGWDRASPSI